MRERPILFSAPMVRALLAGTKTQTRRLVTPQQPKPSTMKPYELELTERDGSITAYTMEQFVATKSRYGQTGDRLWVKETHAFKSIDPTEYLYGPLASLGIRKYGGGAPVHRRDLRVNGTDAMVEYLSHPTSYADLPSWPGYDTYRSDAPKKWRPSIFMPRWASRIALEVTNVRVERLHAITEDDARTEGVDPLPFERKVYPSKHAATVTEWSHRAAFQLLWEAINGAESWRSNPWVWIVEFKVLA